jgi:hypothetical protein
MRGGRLGMCAFCQRSRGKRDYRIPNPALPGESFYFCSGWHRDLWGREAAITAKLRTGQGEVTQEERELLGRLDLYRAPIPRLRLLDRS